MFFQQKCVFSTKDRLINVLNVYNYDRIICWRVIDTSNLANDYGDYTKGVDNDDRVGGFLSKYLSLGNRLNINNYWDYSYNALV